MISVLCKAVLRVASAYKSLFITGAVLSVMLALAPVSLAAAPYTISDNPTGGDCTLIGSWNNAAKTCTLSQDIAVSAATIAIEFGNNNITLDGAGHTISGSGGGAGVSVAGRSGITVKNLVINHFSFGISLGGGSSNCTVSNNSVANSTDGILLINATSITVSHNVVSGSSDVQISLDITAGSNIIDGNTVQNASPAGGISLGSNNNTVRNNLIANNNTSSLAALYISGSSNTVYNNILSGNALGLALYTTANGNAIYNNNFLGNTTQALGVGTGNVFNLAAPVGGNYWSNHATTAQGCANVNNDRFCDSAYTPPASVTDNLPLARRGYYFSWYDMVSAGARDWVLMANPIEAAGEDAWFDLSIAGSLQTLPTISQIPGQVPPAALLPLTQAP